MEPPIHIPSLPIAVNVCDQLLREVDRNDKWSMAHVIMNPRAKSLMHRHLKMTEVYAITRGSGRLITGSGVHDVIPGSVIVLPPGEPHMLVNSGITNLEHLVLASPPFDPADIEMVELDGEPRLFFQGGRLPSPVECFDGATIFPYELADIDISMAFGWVSNDPGRKKKPHCHRTITEYLYIVEGTGHIERNGLINSLSPGDWVKIDPGVYHAIRNPHAQTMVAMCMCSPKFDPADVFFAE